jgi:hypothetical protein
MKNIETNVKLSTHVSYHFSFVEVNYLFNLNRNYLRNFMMSIKHDHTTMFEQMYTTQCYHSMIKLVDMHCISTFTHLLYEDHRNHCHEISVQCWSTSSELFNVTIVDTSVWFLLKSANVDRSVRIILTWVSFSIVHDSYVI